MQQTEFHIFTIKFFIAWKENKSANIARVIRANQIYSACSGGAKKFTLAKYVAENVL